MTQMKRVLPSMALALAAILAATAMAQAPERPRRGFRLGAGPSLLGLLRIERVQQELKLSEENVAKITELREKLTAEMRKELSSLREIEDRQQRRAKIAELSEQFDRKAREQLREVLSQDQMRRLYQIRMQVRPAIDSLTNRFVAGRLELTDEQKEKLAAIAKDRDTKRAELLSDLRQMSQEQRQAAMAKFRAIRAEADEKALGLLTDEQKEAFEKMKGEKIELPSRRRPS